MAPLRNQGEVSVSGEQQVQLERQVGASLWKAL